MQASSAESQPSTERIFTIQKGHDYLIASPSQLPFRFVKQLGHGSSGSVVKYQETCTKAFFACKIINLVGTQGLSRRIFDNEIKNIRNLRGHRHVVEVFATYVSQREFGLILQPLAEEGDLQGFLSDYRNKLKKHNPATSRTLDPELHRVTTILKRSFGCLAQGLAFMHKQRIRHKDIKPRNILIHEGMVVYTDFGFSLDSSQSDHSGTEGPPGAVTIRYAAPEVLDHQPRNSLSDIYSLGCVFLDILLALIDVDLHIEYAEGLDRILKRLQNTEYLTQFCFLVKVSSSMIAIDPKERMTAAEVSDEILQLSGFCCDACLRPEENVMLDESQGIHDENTVTQWSEEHQKFYLLAYTDGAWSFLKWLEGDSSSANRLTVDSNAMGRRGGTIIGNSSTLNTLQHETLDPAFHVKPSSFFKEGRVFAILFTEPTGPNATVTDYNSSYSYAYFGKVVRTQVRRFIVVRQKRHQCFVIPIFRYGNQATLKPGVDEKKHAIAFSWGQQPTPLSGEVLTNDPIGIVMSNGEPPLSTASRIYFGVNHPVQHDVKVKDIGYVHSDFLGRLRGYWNMVSSQEVTAMADNEGDW